MLRVTLCGGIAVEADGRRVPDRLLAGRQGRLVLAYLVCERQRSVSREELAELVWGDRLPPSWASSLSAVVSKLRRFLSEAGLDGPAALASSFGSYRLHLPEDAWVDWESAAAAVATAERLAREGDVGVELDAAVSAARQAGEIAGRGFLSDDCPWVDAQRELVRDVQVRAAQAEAEVHLRSGSGGRAVASAREALALDELREASYRLLMRALAAAGERGEALRVWERCRTLLVEELGIDPAPETEAVYLSILGDAPVAPPAPIASSLPSGVVTFLLTDIVGSTALWDRNPTGMAAALERHDHLAAEAVRAHGGVLLKAKLEGDATVSVFPRASAGARAALALRDALTNEAWPEGAAPAVRMALHTGEAIERDGDYFGPALNRAARLRSLACGGQILVSQAVAEVVRDHLPEDITLRSLGERPLRGLERGEHVFELAPSGSTPGGEAGGAAPLRRPPVPAVLSSREPFVGRGAELERLATDWATAMAGTARATFLAGEPGVGKTRLAAEWARRAHDEEALVLYGRCDEELGAPYQPFAEALRVLVPHLGANRLAPVRGVEELARLVPALADLVPGLRAPSQADPDTERYLLFDALARLVAAVSVERPLLIVVDDLHWAAKPTLLLLRHLLRSGDGTRLQIVGTYRSTDLVRTHPLAGVLADLHGDGTADRLTVAGLDTDEVGSYLRAAGHDDAHLGAALSTVTSGNPFFLIEVLRHVQESGGRWDPSTLPQGVREAVGRRLSRLSADANDALLVAAVAGSRFSLELVERVLERDLVDAFDEARRAGLVLEEPGSGFRFNHALVRQSLLAEVASVKRTRLHQRIAAALEADTAAPGDARLADLARHYFECAFAGGAAKAVDYSRRAGQHAMSRLAYEEAAVLFDQALQAADVDGSGSSDDDRAELLLARCEALLAAGDPTAAIAVVGQLERVARGSPRLSAWARCFAGQLAVLIHPDRLDTTTQDVAGAAQQFAEMDDAEGEAKAHTVRASCLARLGRIADCEAALDQALTAGRRAGNPRRVNAVLAGAPLAALWGPSAVPRASGRCLDVVRVLRITTGSPAVEAIALRCQAVLEALRGRSDAARRMLASARRSLEGLGHTHGLLETDLFSGIVELVADQPVDAEVVLRRAYDGFAARGVGADAAQAAALLARAVLAQDRVEEAIALTEDSERLAGVDLKAAIAWRAVRAEALARQGHPSAALEAASTAVALADATDALIDQADAHLALALVLRAAGDTRAAEREARRAGDLYGRKGATARVDSVQALVGAAEQAPSPATAPVTRRRVRPNLATATQASRAGPWGEHSFEEWASRIGEGYVEIDHRTQITLDREGYLRTLRMWSLMDRVAITVEPLASLGERHSVARLMFQMHGTPVGEERTGPVGAAEVELLEVVRTKPPGLLVRTEYFHPENLDLAFARLLELHAEDEVPHDERAGRSLIAAYMRGDTPFSWTEDAVLVDHRPAGLGTLRGREEIRGAGRALHDVAGDVRRRVNDVLGATERVMLFDLRTEGATDSGEPWEFAMLALGEFDSDGQQRLAEWFDPAQADEALARLDELTAERSPAPRRRVRPNRASECFPGGPIDEALPNTWAAKLRDDFVCVDHRLQLTLDRTQVIETWRLMATGQQPRLEATPLAMLGERHCLYRNTWRSGDTAQSGVSGQSEVAWLNVLRVDADGRAGHLEVFDLDELNEALARLVELHADVELPADERHPQYGAAAMARNTNTRWSDDAVLVDHRPTSLGTLHGRKAIAAAAGALRDVAGDQRRRISDVLGFSERVSLFEMVTEGSVDAGGPFEMSVLSLNVVGDDGLCTRQEWYAPEQVDEALARFDELTAAAPPTARRRVRPNRASECLLVGGRIDHERLAVWAATLGEDFVNVDHRMHVTLDRAALMETWRLMAASGPASVEDTLLATLGDRHCLARNVWRSGGDTGSAMAGPSEVTYLSVLRTHADGLASRLETFDADQLELAVARLVELHADDELPAEQREARRAVAAGLRTTNTPWRDDTVLVDHRPTSLGTLRGRAAIAAAGGALRDVAGDLRRRYTDVLGFTERVHLLEVVTEGSVDAGGPFEITVLSITEVDDEGLCTRQEWYALEQVDEALARFDELAMATAVEHPTTAAVVAWERFTDAILRDDVATLAAALHEDSVLSDRRSLVGGYVLDGRDACLAHVRSLRASGVTNIQAVVLATRGERLILRQESLRGPGAEVDCLLLGELHADGRLLAAISFDADDLDDAFSELDARYLAGEGKPHADTLTPMVDFLAAYNIQDWRRCRELLADDLVVVDHRPAPALYGPVDGPDEFVAALQPLFALASDVCVRALAMHPGGGATASFRLSTTATTAEGSDIELAFHIAYAIRDARITRLEFFAVDQLDAALTRLDELSRPAASAPEGDGLSNAALCRWTDLMALFRTRDWDAVAAMVSEGAVVNDRRPIVGGTRFEGKDGFIAMSQGIAAIGVTEILSTPLANRGDHLALVRAVYRGDAGEVEDLDLIELDDDGHYFDGACFDPDDVGTAFAELDARYAAQLPPEHADAWRLATALTDRYSARDADGLRDLFADDAVIVDDRVTGWGTLDPQSFVDHLQELIGMAPDAFLAYVVVHEIASQGSVARLQVTGTLPGGGVFEIPFECVSIVREGALVRLELLPPGQVDEAIRRFGSR